MATANVDREGIMQDEATGTTSSIVFVVNCWIGIVFRFEKQSHQLEIKGTVCG